MPPTHAKRLGFRRRGKHNATTYSDGFVAQRGIEQLFDGGVKGVEIRMQDGGTPAIASVFCQLPKRVDEMPRRNALSGEHKENITSVVKMAHRKTTT
jgi:hypothetical protein